MIELLLSTSVVANDSLNTIVEIGKNTYNTAENTKFGIIAAITFIVSVASLIVALFTYKSQRATQHNTSRLKKKSQEFIIEDMISHVFVNITYTEAIRILMIKSKFELYPSEVHISNMKVDMGVIKPYFYNDLREDNILKVLHILRDVDNYNHHLDYINEHLSKGNLGAATKGNEIFRIMQSHIVIIKKLIDLLYILLRNEPIVSLNTNDEKHLEKIIHKTMEAIQNNYKDRILTIDTSNAEVLTKYSIDDLASYLNFDDSQKKNLSTTYYSIIRMLCGIDKNGYSIITMLPV